MTDRPGEDRGMDGLTFDETFDKLFDETFDKGMFDEGGADRLLVGEDMRWPETIEETLDESGFVTTDGNADSLLAAVDKGWPETIEATLDESDAVGDGLMAGWRETDEMEGRLGGGADRSMAGEERSMRDEGVVVGNGDKGWPETMEATLNESGSALVGDGLMLGWRETDKTEGEERFMRDEGEFVGNADKGWPDTIEAMLNESGFVGHRLMPGWRETETIEATLNESGFVGD